MAIATTRSASEPTRPGLYLDCSGRGCNGRARGLGESRGRAPVRVWGRSPQKLLVQCNIVPIKTGLCASSDCISLLKRALKLKRHTVDLFLLHTAHTLGYFRDDVYPARGGLDWVR